MSKHTPGPWFFEDSQFWSDYGWVAAQPQPDGGDIVCNPPDLDADASLAHWMANARLISAAPELLDALIYWLPKELPFPNQTKDVVCQSHNNRWHEARAAIAKATGEQP